MIAFSSAQLVDRQLPRNDGRYFYADVETDKQGIQLIDVGVGTPPQPMHLWLSTISAQVGVIKTNSDFEEIYRMAKFDPSKSTSNKETK